MAWDFNQIIEFGRQFSGPAGTELAFVLSEWTAADGLTLTTAYPAVRVNQPPQSALPAAQADNLYVNVGAGWVSVTTLPGFVSAGRGTHGELQSGASSSMVIKAWQAKGIAAGYVIATGATLDQINTDRTTGLALIRTYVNEADGEAHPLAPDTAFTNGQVTVVSTWLNNHGITNQEFAGLFDVSAAQLSNWMQTHSRVQFAQQIHDRFT